MPHVLLRGLWDFQVILVSTTFLDHIFWRIGTVIIKLKKQAKHRTKSKTESAMNTKMGKQYAKTHQIPLPNKSSVHSAQFSRHNIQKDFRQWCFGRRCLTCFRPLKLSQKVRPQLWNPNEQPPCQPPRNAGEFQIPLLPLSAHSTARSHGVATQTALKPIENGP